MPSRRSRPRPNNPNYKPLEKRTAFAAQTVASPEIEDANALVAMLDPETIRALTASAKALPPGEQFEAARGDQLLSMQARHEIIIRMRAQGVNVVRIARAVGVTARTVDNVVKKYVERQGAKLREANMDEFVLLMAEGYLEDMDRLSDIIQRSTHAAAVVGAIKARQEARSKYVDLLADFGFINRKPVDLRVTGDGTTIDARTQNVIVVDAETLKGITKDLLRQKRLNKGQVPDESDDDRLADLVVNAEDFG